MKKFITQIVHRLQLRESWIIFFILGIIMMSFPFLHIFNKPIMIFGIPLLFLYLIVGWMISIAVIYIFMIASRRKNDTTDEKKEP